MNEHLTQLTTPPIPTEPQYGGERLRLVHEFGGRSEYLFAMGEQAPPADPTRPEQNWAAVNVPAGNILEFHDWDPITGGQSFRSIARNWALTVNLPGDYRYPDWKPALTPAFAQGTGGSDPLDPYEIATEAEANELASELGGIVEGPPLIDIYPDGENRKRYEVKIGENGHNAGALLRQKHIFGVGHPSHWQKDGAAIVRVRDPQPQPLAGPKVPVPCRLLDPAQEEAVLQFGGTFTIRKKGAVPPEGTGGVDTHNDVAIAETNKLVRAIAIRFGIPVSD